MDSLSVVFNRVAGRLRRAPGAALVAGVVLALAVGAAACSAQGAPLVKATWVKPQVSGDTLSIPASDVSSKKIVHFPVNVALGTENFMAYELGGKVYVRANVCPPCRSVGFSLAGDKLVCDSCKTVFNAQNGDGVSGACVAYPKASVAYQNIDGKLVMRAGDLQTAYQNTLQPGRP